VDESAEAAAQQVPQDADAEIGRQDVWRGKVQHVLSGRAGRFSDWDNMVQVLLSLLPPEREGSSPPKKDKPTGR
jgi:hypothetical protein